MSPLRFILGWYEMLRLHAVFFSISAGLLRLERLLATLREALMTGKSLHAFALHTLKDKCLQLDRIVRKN